MKKNDTKSSSLPFEIIGWYGTVAIIGAYALNSFGIIATSNPWYQILNATGSIGIIVISLRKKVFQSVILNIIWAAIALVGLGQILIK